MWNSRQIAADADVDRFAFLQGGGNGGVQELVRVLEIVHHRLFKIPQLLCVVDGNGGL